MRFYLNCLGINNSAGGNKKDIFQSIFIEDKNPVQEYDLISGRKTVVRYVNEDLPKIPHHLKEFDSRNNKLLLHAVLQIQSELECFIKKYGRERIAVVLGTSTSGIHESEKVFIHKADHLPKDFIYYKQEVSNASDFLVRYLGLEGLSYTVSTACTSSAKAFIEAKRLLEANLCDAVIVGGVDTASSLTLDGFDALDSVSSKVTNPFSYHRDGINIGEGASVFLMSKEPSFVEFLGYGESSDAYHVSSPDPDGVGAEMAIRQALSMAKLHPSDIGYLNLHGTGTRKNDDMESKVVDRVLGSVPVSSTKPFIGHTLGAAGAQEAALCYMVLTAKNERLLPPHLWDGVQDSELPALNFVKKGDVLRKGICMSNSFAFGGNNVSLILGHYEY